jgi:amino acid adenylation domain-containing protein
MLGVLKAGAAFLPLDPRLPIERLRSVIASARPSALVSLFGTACMMSSIDDAATPVIALDCEGCANHLQEHAADNLLASSIDLTSRHLAYVTYTSGSSGRPKGVAVEHRGICNLAAYQQATFATMPGERVLQFAAPTFDVFVWDWVWALCGGAELHLASREDLLPGEPLLYTITSARITHLMLPPAVLGALPDDADLQSVAVLCVAGEACPLTVAKRWANGRRFANLYGPTETTVIVSGQEVESPALSSPSIGGPVPNTQLHVLDGWLNPVPIGVVGEIFVGGFHVARGYIGDPALTADRFIPDPFGETPGARLYRTGDLGCWRPDGQLEYRGRNDHQVKLRGYRIELEEIGGELRQLPQVQDAIAIVAGTGEARHIVAYAAVPDSTPQQRLALSLALRERLRESLPDYMLPAAVVVVDAIPINTHGKVDRSALPLYDTSTPGATFEGPRSATERMLAAMWAELLGREHVGVHDDFYDIGGHSLLALRAVERLQQVASAARPAIRDMLRFRTIAKLATEFDRRMTDAAAAAP